MSKVWNHRGKLSVLFFSLTLPLFLISFSFLSVLSFLVLQGLPSLAQGFFLPLQNVPYIIKNIFYFLWFQICGTLCSCFTFWGIKSESLYFHLHFILSRLLHVIILYTLYLLLTVYLSIIYCFTAGSLLTIVDKTCSIDLSSLFYCS